jgi:heme-degrading monooxygenase HmoA
MIVTVFRSRLKPGALDEYDPTAKRMSELARQMPGYISHKSFTAEDGERLTLVEFADEASHDGWRLQADHVAAKRRGMQAFYSEYKIQICSVLRGHAWTAPAKS